MFTVRRIAQKLISSLASSPRRVSAFSTASPGHTVKRVGTRKGSFRADQVLGCFMIRLTDKFAGADIVRTRDPKVLDTLDAVLDVGGVYDPEHDRYDHVQEGFNEVFGHGFTTKLSTAGLVFKHYGHEIIAKELQLDPGHPNVHILYLAVYKNFLEAIDGVDNRIDKYKRDEPLRYLDYTGLSSRIRSFDKNKMEDFFDAMSLAGQQFLVCVHFIARRMTSAPESSSAMKP